jgi:hypothetical protein
MSAQVSKEVTTVQVTGVTFGFFTDAEVRHACISMLIRMQYDVLCELDERVDTG